MLKSKKTIGKGLDIGTTFLCSAQKRESQVNFKTQRNVFFDIERTDFTENILERSNITYVSAGDKIYVVGNDAIKFANVLNRNPRRPMKKGVISPDETEALPIMELLIKSVLGLPPEKDEIIYYSVPGSPVDADFNIIYHQNVIKGFLEKWGYRPKPINEGLAVIFSEMTEDNFTGMGISFGGGMANVCLSLMAVPVFSFSVAKAGDWIDEQVAKVANEPVSKVTTFKEASLNLKKPENQMTRVEQALLIYYNSMIEYVLEQIKKEIVRSGSLPKFEKPFPIIISGGTACPPGFLERFKEIFKENNFPLKIKEIKLAPHPLYTVAKGTLIAAITESKNQKQNP